MNNMCNETISHINNLSNRCQMRDKYYITAESGGRTVGVMYDHHCCRIVIGGPISARHRINDMLRIMGAMHAQCVVPTRNKIRWEAEIPLSSFVVGIAIMRDAGFVVTHMRRLGRLMR